VEDATGIPTTHRAEESGTNIGVVADADDDSIFVDGDGSRKSCPLLAIRVLFVPFGLATLEEFI
jgi:hypothetical protein